jgi:TatD DNase family protein
MIDTHCHIDLYDNPLEVAAAAEKLGVKTVGVTYLPSHFVQASKHLTGFKHVHPALGLHPLAAKDHGPELELFGKCFGSVEYVGEVGLDFSGGNKASKPIQEKSFATVIKHLSKASKFVTIHSRGAEDAALAMLREGGIGPVVFHWFSGSKRQLKTLLDAGHSISINTSMIATVKWSEMISFIPRSSILTETDGPFVRISGRPAVPKDVECVISWLAASWKVSPTVVSQQIADNFSYLTADVSRNPNASFV